MLPRTCGVEAMWKQQHRLFGDVNTGARGRRQEHASALRLSELLPAPPPLCDTRNSARSPCSFETPIAVTAARTSGLTCGALRATTTARTAVRVTCPPTRVKTCRTMRRTTELPESRCVCCPNDALSIGHPRRGYWTRGSPQGAAFAQGRYKYVGQKIRPFTFVIPMSKF
jgi:hypothetical protein